MQLLQTTSNNDSLTGEGINSDHNNLPLIHRGPTVQSLEDAWITKQQQTLSWHLFFTILQTDNDKMSNNGSKAQQLQLHTVIKIQHGQSGIWKTLWMCYQNTATVTATWLADGIKDTMEILDTGMIYVPGISRELGGFVMLLKRLCNLKPLIVSSSNTPFSTSTSQLTADH